MVWVGMRGPRIAGSDPGGTRSFAKLVPVPFDQDRRGKIPGRGYARETLCAVSRQHKYNLQKGYCRGYGRLLTRYLSVTVCIMIIYKLATKPQTDEVLWSSVCVLAGLVRGTGIASRIRKHLSIF